jgi:hypothetical protein
MFETDDWQSLLDECLSHEVSNIRSRAASALSPFFTQYYQQEHSHGVNTARRNTVIAAYTEQLAANSQTIRMGFSLALGKCLFYSNKSNQHVASEMMIVY